MKITNEQKLKAENYILQFNNVQLEYKLKSIQLDSIRNKIVKEIEAESGLKFNWNTLQLDKQVEKVVKVKENANNS